MSGPEVRRVLAQKIVHDKHDIKRVRTYINGLDENLQGGIPQGHITLVSGAARTMKSSVSFNILYHEAVNGNNGLYLSLEQSAESLVNHMMNMDYDISKINLVIVKDLAELQAKIQGMRWPTCTGPDGARPV